MPRILLPASARLIGLGVLAAALSASLAPASQAAAGGTTAATATAGSISGLVTGDGHPLIEVCAVALSESGLPSASAVTTKAGTYRISGLAPGPYIVFFTAGTKQCGNDGNWLTQWYPRVNSPFPTSKVKTLRVRAGQDTRGIDGRLTVGGELAGSVRDTSDHALSGICVSIQGTFSSGSIPQSFSLTTNKAGRYVLHGVFPGQYLAEFSIGCGGSGNHAYQWWRDATSQNDASAIKITGTQQVTDIDAALLPGATVSGVVKGVSTAGKPLAGVCVTAVAPDTNVYASDSTDRTGKYSLDGLAPGRYQIEFDAGCITNTTYQLVQRNLTLTTGKTVTGFNAYLPLGG